VSIHNKLSYLILLLLVILLLFNHQDINKNKVYGYWKGDFVNYELEFEFNTDQRFKLKFRDNILQTTKVISGDFFVDYSKKPISLSFRNLPETTYPLHTIIKFKGDNTIFLEKFSTKEKFRPLAFSYDSHLVLNRTL
jgi:hypothetical protein